MSAAHDKPALTPRQRAQARQATPPAITQLDPGKVDERLAGWHWVRKGGEDSAPYEFRLTGPDGWPTKFYQDDTKAIAEALRRVRSQPKQKEPDVTTLTAPAPTQLVLFDYEQLDVETRIVVRERATQARDEIRRLASLVRQTAETVWALGEKLADVQARLAPDGLWLAWCDAELPGVSRGTIYNAINVYRAFPQLPTVGNGEALEMPLRALYLLAAPSTPDAAREEATQLIEAGEPISAAEAVEIVARHKPAPAPALAPARREPEPAIEDEELDPHEQQVAATYTPPAPPTPVTPELAPVAVEGEVIATVAPAPALTPLAASTPPPLMPLTPLAPLAPPPLAAGDTQALRSAEALVALLQMALTLAQVERDALQRDLPDAHYDLPDAPVEQAARTFLSNTVTRASAGFLAMHAREAQ
jgi:hypothetical protein